MTDPQRLEGSSGTIIFDVNPEDVYTWTFIGTWGGGTVSCYYRESTSASDVKMKRDDASRTHVQLTENDVIKVDPIPGGVDKVKFVLSGGTNANILVTQKVISDRKR